MPAVLSPLLIALCLPLVLQSARASSPLHRVQSAEDRTDSLGLTRFIGAAAIPGTPRFMPAQHFRESLARTAPVKILWIGRNFRRHFLGKVEDNVGPTEIGVHRLRRPARDQAIIAAIGERHETRLAHLWWLLSRQPNGESGPLALGGVPNVFYIRGMNGRLWAVDAVWSGAGWEIGASALDDPRPWGAGRQIMSR